ncbi:MAG: hypothetical protein ABI837_12190, partial [Acidobacteriota bacterium]
AGRGSLNEIERAPAACASNGWSAAVTAGSVAGTAGGVGWPSLRRHRYFGRTMRRLSSESLKRD